MIRNILTIHSDCPAGNSSILRILKRRRRLAVTQSSLACFCPAPTWSKLPQSSSKKSFWLLLCMSNTFCMVIKDIWTRKSSPRLLYFISQEIVYHISWLKRSGEKWQNIICNRWQVKDGSMDFHLPYKSVSTYINIDVSM